MLIRLNMVILNINPLLHDNAFEKLCIWKYYGKWSICSLGANAPFSIKFSKVFRLHFNFS